MISPSAKFGFHLAGLWLIIGCLAVITSITLLSTFVRSDCQAIPRLNVTAVADSVGNSSCSSAERISNFALSNTAYLQSIHTVTIQVVVAASLLVLQPVLRALIWSSLETEETSRVPSLESLQCRIQLSTSPGLMPGIADALTSRFLTSTTAFVIFLGILSLVTPIVVSPIYRMRKGVLYGAQINIVMEGGVGLSVTPVYVPNANAAVGVVAGRAFPKLHTQPWTPLPFTSHLTVDHLLRGDSCLRTPQVSSLTSPIVTGTRMSYLEYYPPEETSLVNC